MGTCEALALALGGAGAGIFDLFVGAVTLSELARIKAALAEEPAPMLGGTTMSRTSAQMDDGEYGRQQSKGG